MTAAATAALARANVLGISLALGRERDGAACLLWRGPRGAMTEDLKADLTANKAELLAHLKDERAIGDHDCVFVSLRPPWKGLSPV